MKNLDRRKFLATTITSLPAIMFGGGILQSTAGLAFTGFQKNTDPVDAETIYGKIRGYSVDDVSIFRGIPYGGPTEGSARFLPPTKPEKWTGVKDATVNGLRCVQSIGNIFQSPLLGEYFAGGRKDRLDIAKESDSDNCLYLNVLTKGLNGKRPVMVYIHGGGFSSGSGLLTAYSDKFVSEQDVVLVGINHRLNVFGYTYLGGLSDKYATGNPGQLDLVAALEWVRDNITHFGGDPNNVTIFGESGGGAKISTLLAMPAAKGLFHKAIIQSGSLLKAMDKDAATKLTKDLMTKLGVSNVEDLQKVSTADLFKASPGGFGGAGPVIDGHSLPNQTWDPVAPAISANIPLMIGNDKDESSLFAMGNQSLYNLDDAGLRSALVNARVPEDKVDKLLSIYKRDHSTESNSNLYFRISTDRGARWNAVKQAELQIAQGKANVFMYYFQWNTPLADGKLRSFHTADLPLTMRLVLNPEAEQLSKQLSGAWAAFARKSNPSQGNLPWPAYTLSQRATMIFDASKSEVINDPDKEERLLIKDMPSGGLL